METNEALVALRGGGSVLERGEPEIIQGGMGSIT